MADNPYVNKVVLGNQTIMDITDTTATANDVATGKYFYTAAGARTAGTYTPQGLLPQGGSADDVLTKVSATDYDATWSAPSWVEKTGDIMTGSLELRSPNITSGSTTTAYGNSHLDINDVNGVNFGYFQPVTGAAGQGIQFAATRSGVYHGVTLYIDSSGNCYAYFNNAAAWRRGLGLNYVVNETLSIEPCIMSGYIGNSSKSLYLIVYTPKSLEDISTITVTAMTGALRSTSGNIGGTDSNTNILTSYTVATRKCSNNMIRVQVTASSAFSGVTNMAPAVFGGTMTLKFT